MSKCGQAGGSVFLPISQPRIPDFATVWVCQEPPLTGQPLALEDCCKRLRRLTDIKDVMLSSLSTVQDMILNPAGCIAIRADPLVKSGTAGSRHKERLLQWRLEGGLRMGLSACTDALGLMLGIPVELVQP